jgi:hypothetical protein
MQNKKVLIVLGAAILLIGIAAFIAGRMFNTRFSSVGASGPMGNGQVFISRDDVIPAPELPTTPPELTGLFLERKDNTVIVHQVSFDPGIGGILNDSPLDENSGPKV